VTKPYKVAHVIEIYEGEYAPFIRINGQMEVQEFETKEKALEYFETLRKSFGVDSGNQR
jgi:hypothetical protein